MRQMSIRTLITLFVVGVLAALPASAQCICDLSEQDFRGSLFGNQFTDGTLSPTGFGTFEGNFNADGTIDFDVRTRGIDIQEGLTTFSLVRTSDGQIVSNLSPIDRGDGNFSVSGELDPLVMRDVRRNPGNFSIRVGNAAFPMGAIEGPITVNRRFTGSFAGDDRISFTTEFRNEPDGTLLSDFELFSDDIDDIESIELFDRETGTTHDFFDESGTLIDGRLFGEDIEIEGTVADEFIENPDRFDIVVRTNDVSGGELRARAVTVNDLFIPVVGSVQGAQGSSWDTDLRLFNTSFEASSTVALTFHPRGGMLEPVSTSVTLEPRQTLMFDEAMAQLFPGVDGIGALRISTGGDVVASARIFNDQRDTGAGTFGQRMAALTICDAMTRGVLTGVTDSTGTTAGTFAARTNLGIFNPNAHPVQVDLTLRDGDGDLVETRTVNLGAGMHTQSSLIAASGFFNISEEVANGTLTFEASSPVFVYGSVVDNDSGDPSTLMPSFDFGVPAL